MLFDYHWDEGARGEFVACHEAWAWCQDCWSVVSKTDQASEVKADEVRNSKDKPKPKHYKIPKKPKCSYCGEEDGIRKCTHHVGCNNNAHHMCFIDFVEQTKIKQ